MEDCTSFLPPGFRFDPTDEELVRYFLYHKASNLQLNPSIIPELDFYLTDPWKLKDKAFLSKNQYYFFSRRTENRATEKGDWEELDINETIITSLGKVMRIKKFLVFFIHDALKRTQTNWCMEEYHLCSSDFFSGYCRKGLNGSLNPNEWMLCRVHYGKTESHGIDFHVHNNGSEVELSLMDEIFLSMEDDDQYEISFPS